MCSILYKQVFADGSIAQLGEHLPYKQRVIGSSPIVPTITCGNSSAGRALPCQGKCRGSESRFPLHFYLRRGGEIGRRKGLKIPRWKHHIGSSPIPGTTEHDDVNRRVYFIKTALLYI